MLRHGDMQGTIVAKAVGESGKFTRKGLGITLGLPIQGISYRRCCQVNGGDSRRSKKYEETKEEAYTLSNLH
jgi:hypothetical protein